MKMVEVKDLSVSLGFGPEERRILKDIAFSVPEGACFGLVGESGSGKSTILRCMARLLTTWQGTIAIAGEDVRQISAKSYCRLAQMVFQDPYGSLHPRQSVETTLLEPLRIHRIDNQRQRAEQVLRDVGLDAGFLPRFPHELSGGQRQRIAIARALMLEPKVLLLDEPTSALDVSVQAEVLNLLSRLRTERGLTYLIVSHDLAVIDHMCDDFAIMNGGELVEILPRQALVDGSAQHPYSRSLIEASLEYDQAV